MDKGSFTKDIQRKESFKLQKKLDNHQDSKVSIRGGSGQRKDPNDDGYVSISDIGGFNYSSND